MRIHIIGGRGRGQTHLAKRLALEYAITHYDLDDLQWDNAARDYGTKRDPAQRDALLQEILRHDDWIIEGVYYAWCSDCFAQADRIYVLDVPRRIYRARILRRFLLRKLGLEQGKRETLRSLSELLKWADQYQKKALPEIRRLLEPYHDKLAASVPEEKP